MSGLLELLVKYPHLTEDSWTADYNVIPGNFVVTTEVFIACQIKILANRFPTNQEKACENGRLGLNKDGLFDNFTHPKYSSCDDCPVRKKLVTKLQ